MLTSSRGCWLGPLSFTCRRQRGWRWDKRGAASSQPKKGVEREPKKDGEMPGDLQKSLEPNTNQPFLTRRP